MNEIERVYEELVEIRKIVISSNDASAIADYGAYSAKVLLLAVASYFERMVISAIQKYLNNSIKSTPIRHFSFHQAVERKFFNFFDFSSNAKNINKFISVFGDDFSLWATNDLKIQGIGQEIQVEFLGLCRLRNSLVHENYATYLINKTLDEIKESFDKASKVVFWINEAFDKFELEKTDHSIL